MQFDLVSPERRLASMEANAVQIPGTGGDMTVMQDHAPVITTLRPGIVRVEGSGAAEEYVVTGGFAEVGSAGISVLAEEAFSKADVSREMLDGLISAARDVASGASAETVDMANKRVADLEALSAALA